MASKIHVTRHVKCPKCHKILPEPTDIPVYACGGCGKILRAKYSFTKENVASIQSNSSNALSSGSLGNRLPPLTETGPCSTEVENGVKEAAMNDQKPDQPLPSSNDAFKAPSLELEECSGDSRGADEHIPKPAIRSEAERKEADLSSNVVTDHTREIKEDDSFNVELERSPKLGQLSHEDLNVIYGRLNTADTVLHSDSHGNNLVSSMRKSHTYVNKVFSADGDYNHHAQNGTTFSLESDKNTNKAKEEHLVVNAMSVETESRVQADDLTTRSPSGSYKQAGDGTVDSPSKYKSRTQTGISVDSTKNWLEPEIDVPLKSPVKADVVNEYIQDGKKVRSPSELKSLEHVRLEILKKVDELKYEISDLFHVCVENKGKSHIGGTREDKHRRFDLAHDRLKAHKKGESFQQKSQIASLLPPGTCLHCLHEGCQKALKTSQKVLCCNGFCQACSKDRPNLSYIKTQKYDQQQEKSYHKEKKDHTKHHCRPALGGAPFVVCYNCMGLLQLPQDFLVTRKQFYRLQCGSCYTMLRYSFRSRNFRPLQTEIQETPNEVEHPPSEVDNSYDTILGNGICHLKDDQQWDPISYPEDYGHSNGLIYSTEIESPLHVSRNSSGSIVLKNGKLHRLLGYGSASQLLYRHSDTDEGFESTVQDSPQSSRESEEEYIRNKIKGKGIYNPQLSVRNNYPGFIKIQDEDELPKRLRTEGGASYHHGLPKHRHMK